MAAPSASDVAAGVPAGVDIVQRIPAPGGGEWLVGSDGGMFAIGGAPYLGSYQGYLQSAGLVGKETRQFGPDAGTVAGGGYSLKSTTGESYNFPGAAPPAAAAAATVAAPAAAAPPVGQGTPEQNSAIGTINANLSLLGLPASLASWAWGEIQKGVPPTQVLLDLEGTPEFQKRFPAIQALRDRAANGEQVHVPTPGEYKSFEDTTAGLMKAAGLPAGFYDSPSDFTGFILNQTSPAEIASRIQGAKAAVYSTPPEARDAMQRYYGMTPGDATAMWLDPTKAVPLLENQAAAARIGGAAASTGYGLLTRAEAEGLQGGGLSDAGAQTGFSGLALEKPLFSNLAGETTAGSDITRSEQLGTLTGNAPAITDIERRRAARKAAFEGGGGAASGGTGKQGIGSAGQ